MTVILNLADVPKVDAAELDIPMRLLIGKGQGLALLKGLTEREIRDLGVGVIYAEDGRAYRFEQTAIRNRREDLEGHEVHFELAAARVCSSNAASG